MKHFELEQWVDFVRGLGIATERAAMQLHLSSDCKQCAAKVEMLQKLNDAASADVSYRIPDYAVHMARSIYALQRPEKVQLLPRLLAKLTFDSFQEPMLAGVRSQQRLIRQALYEAGDYSLDLRIEHERGAALVVLVGQVINRREPGQKMSDVPVMLMSGKEVLGRAISNRFGEFQMEYKPKRSLQLHVPVQHAGKRIEVKLGQLFDPLGRKGNT